MTRSTRMRQGCRAAAALSLGCLVWFGGCHRRIMPPALPAVVQAPVTPPPNPPAPAMPSPPPEGIATAPAVKVTQKPPRHRPRRPVTKPAATATAGTTPPPPEVAAAILAPGPPAPESSPIGALSTGADSSPKTQQDVADSISATERRINGLSPSAANQQQTEVREIRHFIDRAREALKTGDAEGARTLATKARLLMDDLEKWAQKS